MQNVHELLIGCLFITFYAYGRYNTPPSNRGSTTFGRFSICWMLYASVLLIIYWLFTVFAQVSPEIVSRLLSHAGMAGDGGSGKLSALNSPITTALIFITILPNIPVISRIDRNLLQFFWDLGEIPSHAVKLSHRLYRSPYHVNPNLVSRIERYAEEYNIERDSLVFEQESTPSFYWSETCALLLQIEDWKDHQSVRYARFLKNHETDLEEIKAEFATFSTRIASHNKRVDEVAEASLSELRKDIYEHLLSDGQSLLRRCCRFLAHAVLTLELNTEPRFQAIEMLGFETNPSQSENLTPTQLVTLWGLIMAAFLLVSYVEHVALSEPGQGGGISRIVFVAILMSVNYGVSAFIGIYPKTRWRFADIETTKTRPILGYVFSGAAAVAISIVVIIALRFTNYTIQGIDYEQSFDKVVGDLKWTYPYLLQSFAIGFVIAFVADNDVGQNKLFAQWRDAAIIAVIFVIASLITYGALHGAFFFEGTKIKDYRDTELVFLPFFLVKSAIVGLLIGYLVPTWYRANRIRTPWQWVARFVDRNSDELKIEAGKLSPGELRAALITGTAAVTLADGRVDEIEKDVIRKCLGKLAEYEVLDFTVTEAMKELVEGISKWQADNKAVEVINLAAIEPLRGRVALSEMLVQLCLAIGLADGVFGDSERAVVDQIIDALNVDKSQFPAHVALAIQPA